MEETSSKPTAAVLTPKNRQGTQHGAHNALASFGFFQEYSRHRRERP
jgi:hypothetical protein